MKSTKEWISISDMMTGLMMVFLFIAIVYIDQVQKDSKKSQESIQKIDKITKKHENYKEIIANMLNKEFQHDLKKWKAIIPQDNSLTIRFLSPDIMFNAGSSTIKKEFKNILSDFCPRYFNVLYKLRKEINEVRIEGHTSKEWKGALSKKDAYFKNMKLSQDRTRSVLQYCVMLNDIKTDINNWMMKILTANGLSSSRPTKECLHDSVRCRNLRRRVEFRISVNEIHVLNAVIETVKNFLHHLNRKLPETEKN